MPLFRPGSSSASRPLRPFSGAAGPFHPGRLAGQGTRLIGVATPEPAEPALEEPTTSVAVDVSAPELSHAETPAWASEFAAEAPAVVGEEPLADLIEPPSSSDITSDSALDTQSLLEQAVAPELAWDVEPEDQGLPTEPVPELLASEEVVDVTMAEVPGEVIEASVAEEQGTAAPVELVESTLPSTDDVELESAPGPVAAWAEPLYSAVDIAPSAEVVSVQAPVEVESVTEIALPNETLTADFQSLVAETDGRERALLVLETVARRVRAGEISVSADAGPSDESVLASILASLLSNRP